MSEELFSIYKRNFPFIIKDDGSVRYILSHKNNVVFEKRNEKGELIGAAVVNGSTIMMMCVDKEYRRQGIGSELLKQAEDAVRSAGHKSINAGVGFNYLMPGVPTSDHYYPSVNEGLSEGVENCASEFFTHRGYYHDNDSDIFDMLFPLKDFCKEDHSAGDTINGVTYRWAGISDLESIRACTDDAIEEFTEYYDNESLYNGDPNSRVLIAEVGGEVAGTLMVDCSPSGMGTIGCMAVKTAFRGRKIATFLTILATKHLRDQGMKEAFLSYTYSGLDRLYGAAGYKINVYYMMARKKLK